MTDLGYPENPVGPLVRVDYERSTSVYMPPRRWEGRQVLNSELHDLARCAKRASKDQLFLGIFGGGAIGVATGAIAPGLDPWYRALYIGLALVLALFSVYLYQRLDSVEDETERILKQIENEQAARPPVQ